MLEIQRVTLSCSSCSFPCLCFHFAGYDTHVSGHWESWQLLNSVSEVRLYLQFDVSLTKVKDEKKIIILKNIVRRRKSCRAK